VLFGYHYTDTQQSLQSVIASLSSDYGVQSECQIVVDNVTMLQPVNYSTQPRMTPALILLQQLIALVTLHV